MHSFFNVESGFLETISLKGCKMGKAAGGMHFPLLDAIPILPLPDSFAMKDKVTFKITYLYK